LQISIHKSVKSVNSINFGGFAQAIPAANQRGITPSQDLQPPLTASNHRNAHASLSYQDAGYSAL